MKNIENKKALVTGAGQGIGRAIAIRLALEGAIVFVNDVIREKAESVVSEIVSEGGCADVKCADVSNPSEVKRMILEITAKYGGIDILINSARVEPPRPATLPMEEWWDRVIAVALKGAYLCISSCFDFMRQAKYGRIINISSIQAYAGKADEEWIAYSSAKSGMHGLTRSYARLGMQDGVTANIVAPDLIVTEVMQRRWQHGEFEQLEKTVPMGRSGKPEDVVKAVMFLIDSDFITGETIFVNGGRFVIQ
jgi:NAD(P)-dependent dehydrogenase (short-subunit alcohol dehydrogenase family)